jgi:hypothetical protein
MLGIHENVCYMMTLRNAAFNEVQMDTRALSLSLSIYIYIYIYFLCLSPDITLIKYILIPLHHETRDLQIIDTRMTCEFEQKLWYQNLSGI